MVQMLDPSVIEAITKPVDEQKLVDGLSTLVLLSILDRDKVQEVIDTRDWAKGVQLLHYGRSVQRSRRIG